MIALKKLFTSVAGAVPKLKATIGMVFTTLDVTGALTASGAISATQIAQAMVTLVDGAAVAIDATLGGTFTLTCVNNNARVFGVPTGGIAGQRITVRIINTSGGALTVTTFNASIKQPALTYPATATQKEYHLLFDGAQWLVESYGPANVPN